jgi:transcriptional regulator GlxA family with amidase domain
MRQRTNPTKTTGKTATIVARQLHVGVVCDEGSSQAGIHGLSDLFKYAGEFASKHAPEPATPAVRVTHWLADAGDGAVRCTYDSQPGATHGPSVLVIPGNERAVLNTNTGRVLLDWLRHRHADGVVLAAVCGGVFILARTGLLAGRQATTHWALSDEFADQFPEVLTESDQMVIDYGDVLTAGGVLAWADLGLRLTERFLGATVMLETARYMLVDPPGREQRFYSDFVPRTKHGDSAILKAQLWLSARRERRIRVLELARHAGLEPRTFLRRFVKATDMNPSEYQQRLRITRARELLEFSRTSVEEIAARVGYDDVDSFRRVFRKIVGVTPSDHRRRFSAGRVASESLKVQRSPNAQPRALPASKRRRTARAT